MLQEPPTNGMTGFVICNGLLLIRAENTGFSLQTSNHSFDCTFEVSFLNEFRGVTRGMQSRLVANIRNIRTRKPGC
jgi:hypothetical protein